MQHHFITSPELFLRETRVMTHCAAHFDNLYHTKGDPWDSASSEYERRKSDGTLGALARLQYPNCQEADCSIGVLSARLADRCDMLTALDLSALAVSWLLLTTKQAHEHFCASLALERRREVIAQPPTCG